jgi:hypothetical protein
VCGNPARTDLCGGRSAMGVPTANPEPTPACGKRRCSGFCFSEPHLFCRCEPIEIVELVKVELVGPQPRRAYLQGVHEMNARPAEQARPGCGPPAEFRRQNNVIAARSWHIIEPSGGMIRTIDNISHLSYPPFNRPKNLNQAPRRRGCNVPTHLTPSWWGVVITP